MIELINPNNVFDKFFSVKTSQLEGINNNNSVPASFELDSLESQVIGIVKSALSPNMEAFIAGGWVRDKILGRESKDIDIAVVLKDGSDQQKLAAAEQLYTNIFGRPPDSNRKTEIGTIINVPIGGLEVDITPFRQEFGPRHNLTIKPGDIKTECERRDLTLNSLFYNVKNNNVVDYTQRGIRDLQNGIIDTPLDPDTTFSEDPSRIMRAFRFMTTLGFNMHPRLIESLKKPEIQALVNPENRGTKFEGTKAQKASPAEINFTELKKMLSVNNGSNIVRTLETMIETGVFRDIFGIPKHFLPLDTPHNNRYHYQDIIQHTFTVFKNLDDRLPDDNNSRFVLRMAAIYHDVGKLDPKIRQEKESDPGQYRYSKHPLSSGDVATDAFKKRIAIPKNLGSRVLRMIHLHDDFIDAGNINASDVYDLARKAAGPGNKNKEDVDNLITFLYADRKAHKKPWGDDVADLQQIEQHVGNMGDTIWNDYGDIVNGNDVLSRLKVGSDKAMIQRVLGETRRAIVNSQINTREEALVYLENQMKRYHILKEPELLVPKIQIIEHFEPYFGGKGSWINPLIDRFVELQENGLDFDEIIGILDQEVLKNKE